MRPRRTDIVRALLRSFSVQGSWNHRTMSGPGMAHAMAPLLARIFADDADALQSAIERHSLAFNAHPYLTPVAIGALARLEYGGEDPDTVARFRSALRAPLGALGDETVWAGWRPFCASVAAAGFLLGLDPVVAAAGFLIVYNLGHLALRLWGLRLGWRAGRTVAAALRGVPFRKAARALVLANQFLIGAVAALLIARIPGATADLWIGALAVLAALSGYLVPRHVSGAAMASLLAACVVWLL
ncbi:PTS system mannose/fructose/sorbose family transporter subunit IID [Candidatus Palauibacter sp.]|uniref:PTS system mannose/fructose/sorbose family transporter subunit IID n=1 Tax=Candidatus Palauibacter sp. TaxID=3101350 RepID=UPI003AF23C2D